MRGNKGTRVLAIGIDAAEPSLIRQLIEQNEMPALGSLLAQGKWLRVKSPAHIGSGSVWPTFISGDDPSTHGVYGEWCWRPETMSLVRYNGRNLKPFWKALSQKGFSVGVLDLPFATPVGLTEGFEIIEWGAHDTLDGRTQAGPVEISEFLARQLEPHPLSLDRHDNAHPDDPRELERLSSSCLKGVRLRGSLAEALLRETQPDLALIVFPEIHHSAHHLWHLNEFDPQLHSGLEYAEAQPGKPSLKEIYLEVDRQIASLIEATGNGASVMVFSLHGMRSAAGVSAFLQPLLCEKGFSCLAGWRAQSWSQRALSLLALAKRHTPAGLKKLYYDTLPLAATQQVARPTMMPAYVWRRTRAFSLPTDQHGWIRINLQGRESEGIVSPGEYDDTCRQLEELLRGLSREDGKPLVRQVIRTAANWEEAKALRLPDLIVHWEDTAIAAPSRIRGSAVEIQTIGKKFTGQHAPDGFCILKGRTSLYENDKLVAKDIHLLITTLLGARAETEHHLPQTNQMSGVS